MLTNRLTRSSPLHLGPLHLASIAPSSLDSLQRVIHKRMLGPRRLATQTRQRINAPVSLGQQL